MWQEVEGFVKAQKEKAKNARTPGKVPRQEAESDRQDLVRLGTLIGQLPPAQFRKMMLTACTEQLRKRFDAKDSSDPEETTSQI